MPAKIILFGFLVENEYFVDKTKSDYYPQVAARKLEYGYLSGFAGNKIKVEIFGFFPASTYPANKNVLFLYRKWSVFGFECHQIPFVNFIGIKFISRTVNLLVCSFNVIRLERKSAAICIYSTHTPFLIVACIAKLIFNIPFYVVVPDLPSLMNVGSGRGKIFSWLKKIDSYISIFLTSKASGISAVTKYIAADVPCWNGVPSVVIEGINHKIIPEVDVIDRGGQRQYFLYSGGLSDSYGVGYLVQAFLNSDIDADLWLCGSGSLVDYILQCHEKDSRIKYMGFMGQNDLYAAQINSLGLLITRNPNDDYVRYSFPSKLIEYMATGIPVLCTKLPGIPDEYYNYISVIDSTSVEDIRLALALHLKKNLNLRKEQGRKAKKFIEERCNPPVAVLPFIKLMRFEND